MMRSGKRLDSSVIFIGEDEAPLLKDAWGNQKTKQRIKNYKTGTLSPSRGMVKCLPTTFLNYLLSQNSVMGRLATSLCPPFGKYNRIPVDAEGSFLSCFLLICTLYWGYVNSRREARISAIVRATCLTLGYLIVVSGITWLLSFCTKTIITLSQVLVVLSYSLFGYSITLLVCTVGSDRLFMPLLTVVGGLVTIRICFILGLRTPTPACRFLLCTPIAIVHLLYLVYLHFTIMKNIF